MPSLNTPHGLLLVRPASFAYNSETASSNAFQHKGEHDGEQIRQQALLEFNQAITLLQQLNIPLVIVEDTAVPKKPDALFPNNWISTHPNGWIITYPMMAESRRNERREDIIKLLKLKYAVNKVWDISGAEWDNKYLEGTGSIVFDHDHKLAYACRSSRTNEVVLNELCKQIEYQSIVFDSLDESESPIYHTNVMMWIGEKMAAVCIDSLRSEQDQDNVLDRLSQSNHKIIAISYDQMKAFAGNMFEIKNAEGQPFLLMSQTAYQTLLPGQINEMSKHAEPIIVSIDTIEKYGGGGIRCMVAGIYLPQKNAV